MANDKIIDEQASDGLSVAPDGDDAETRATHDEDEDTPRVRPASDADDNAALRRDPSDEDAKLDVALDETFPTSDAPSNTQPGKGNDPAPSSGFDEDAERRMRSGD